MNLRWPAAILALLVAAGTVKSSAAMAWLPMDLTEATVIVLVLAGFNVFLQASRHGVRLPWGWMLAAVAFGVVGLWRSPDTAYAETKVLALFVATLGCSFIGGLLLVRTPRQREALAWGTCGVGILVALLARIAPATGVELYGRLALSGAATIGPARIVGASVVVLIALSVVGRIRMLVGMPLAVVLLGVMVATGSRGPLVAAALSLAATLLLLPTRRRGRALGVIVLLSIAGVRIVDSSTATVRTRMLLLISDDRGASVSVREWLMNATWEAIIQDPMGQGWGGLSPLLAPMSDYPHNIVLEVAGEAGVIGGLALIVALVVGLRQAGRAARAGDQSALPLFALLVFWLVNALVSGDINDNRGLFVAMGACLAIGVATTGECTAGEGPRYQSHEPRSPRTAVTTHRS